MTDWSRHSDPAHTPIGRKDDDIAHHPTHDTDDNTWHHDIADDDTWYDDIDHDGVEYDGFDGDADREGGCGGRRFSRRSFLGAAGVGTGAAVLAGVPAVAAASGRRRNDDDRNRGDDRDRDRGGSSRRSDDDGDRGRRDDGPGRFTRIFDDLPPFAEPSDALTAALVELSRPGGLLDANDPIEVGPVRLITEPELSPNNPDNPTHTAGTTFVGQFIDHDITRDAGSTLGRPTNLRRSMNLRTPRLDLDTVYGGGPAVMPELYDAATLRFRVESGGQFEDLPRGDDGRAVIADPRNDENMMLSGLQVAFLLFHNALADRVEAGGRSGVDAFTEARRLVRWHWQWLVVHQFLPQFVGQAMTDDVLANGRRFFNPRRLQIPVEFQTAAFRFGHSMVRPSYRANLAGDNGEPFFAMIFDPDKLDGPDPDTLLGGYRAPRRFIGWQTFFDFDDGEVKPNKRIDTSISTPLFRLPAFTIDRGRGEELGPTSLATRNVLRHITWQLPSGQAVAAAMGAPVLADADLADIAAFGAGLGTSTPLWVYILREAGVLADGLHLGPVGGRIVAETLHAILTTDPTSYLAVEPGWRPTLPSTSGPGEFTMTDLLTLAGVDPASRGQ
ncbi:MAG: heme peroxidase family protein [Actinomycetota bacterium]